MMENGKSPRDGTIIRDKDTLEQMAFIARGFVGKRLTYEDLVA